MFDCNNINLLTFTYYFKLFLGINMTVIPFIYLEKTLIQILRRREKNQKITNYFLKKQFKQILMITTVFILSLTLHRTLNTDTNVCYTYATPNTYHEYKKTYQKLQNEEVDTKTKQETLKTLLLNTKEENKEQEIKTTTINNLTKENEIKPIGKEENIFLNETDLQKRNQVYIQNGIFYYPKYVYGNQSTYSGKYCPSQTQLNEYNNPYGYNNYFYTRLVKFIEEAKENGYKITFGGQGCRNYNTQVQYYNTMTRGRAARPGLSLHGFGIASDLEFYQSNGYACGSGRTESSCPSMKWAHQNAYRFGLTFPLLNASYKEDWHVEPIDKRQY